MLRGAFLFGALLVLLGGLLLVRPLTLQPRPEPVAHTIERTRNVRIPSTTLGSETGVHDSRRADTVLVSGGGADELPEGPAGFDVFDDGSFLIADPLRKRLAVFSPEGKFVRELKVGIAVDNLAITPNGSIRVREASTEDIYFFDYEGLPKKAAAERETAEPREEARLFSGNSGIVTGQQGGGVVKVEFNRPGLRLLSLERLTTDSAGNSYVALEAGKNGETIDVSKFVRKYSATGNLVSEVSDIPLDYYVTPVNELRVRKGVLYQLRTTRSDVQVNVWDMN